ncbi:hypothetical protein PT974_00179 [Cladobotryum mycophilum]|uniref:Uncharacterized protein n=1 Tax=Cladobotryum mycophilum TaxID=491253 RepID=A0ABR0T0Z2_9HYPO
MASPQGTSTRLRRTFHYPDDDSDSDSQPEAMDEQEQDQFIQTLSQENALRNEQFSRFLLLLPLATTAAYIRPLLRPGTAVFALLSITSLLVTAFLLYRLPATETGIVPLDTWAHSSSSSNNSTARRNTFPSRAGLRGMAGRGLPIGAGRSPLEKYLPYMNLALTVLLMLMGLVRGDDRGGGFGWVSMGNLPALIYSVIVTSKIVMAGVDPERDLAGLRYEYKGA